MAPSWASAWDVNQFGSIHKTEYFSSKEFHVVYAASVNYY
jgi:hypothetical protein